jgi:biopolymer transport protein ExbD
MRFRGSLQSGRFKRDSGRRIKATVELTPLIDVVFQLLIFFMLSSTFVVQTSIPIEAPEAQGTTQIEEKDVTVTLQYDPDLPEGEGRLFVGDTQMTDWGQLAEVLAIRHEETPDALVLIRADARIDTGHTIKALGIVTSVGFEKYGVYAESPNAGEPDAP